MTMSRQEQMSKDCDWKQTIHLGIYIYIYIFMWLKEGYLLVEETQVDGYLSVGDVSGQTIWY
jgi:hypothetical protein